MTADHARYMNQSTPDPHEHWDRVAQGWKRWWPTIEQGAQHISARMLELANVEVGQRVLDIAAGIGEPALSAVQRVGVTGHVTATDISPGMLAIARERAHSLGMKHVDFVVADAEHLPVPEASFHAVTCRWGVTSLPDPPAVLAAVRRMLTVDGSFVTAVWESGPKGRPLAGIAAAVLAEMSEVQVSRSDTSAENVTEDSVQPGLQQQMDTAGFRNVYIEELKLVLEWSSAAECARYLVDVSPDLTVAMAAQPAAEQDEFRSRLAEALQPHVNDNGVVRVVNTTLCAVGQR